MIHHTIEVPNDFLDVMSLAGIIIFAITTISAILSSIFVKRDNLFYLGTQIVLLALVLRTAAHWTYPAWFSGVFGNIEELIEAISMLLLLGVAYTLDMGIKVLVWEGSLFRHDNRSVPPLLVASTRVIIYLFAALIILQFVFNKPITALAALSGALAVILGLSAQATLGEIFSGIALALSRPFRVGDWIKIGTLEEGHVIEMTWRMVMVETRDRVVLCIPNRSAADQTVRNFSYPNRAVRITEPIWFSNAEDPAAIQRLLVEALADTRGILTEPRPYTLYRGAKDGVAEYSLRYYIDDYKDKDSATEAVWKCVIDHVARSDVVISYPRRYVAIDRQGGPAEAADPLETAAAAMVTGRPTAGVR